MGMSNGAMFAHRLACERSNVLAAVATVAGSLPEETSKRCKPSTPLSIASFFGTDDRIVPFDGGEVRGPLRMKKLGSVLSSKDTALLWKAKNLCKSESASPSVNLIPDDGTSYTTETFGQCAGGVEVKRWIIQGGGHSWPGGSLDRLNFTRTRISSEIDASSEIWRFFAAHPRTDLANPLPSVMDQRSTIHDQ
jgi:polyhydroxybutyrate depolymerase